MLRFIAVAVLVVSTLFTAGCFGAREMDEIAFVLTMGIDKSTQEGKYDITFQIAVPRAVASQSAKGEDLSLMVTVIADNTAEARNLLNSITARTPIVSHTKAIVIGESLARQGLGDILGPIVRFREFRGSMFIIVVNGDSARNFIQKNTPKIDIEPSRYYETSLLSSDETSYYLETHLHEFYTRLKSSSAAPIAVLGGINDLSGGTVSKSKVPPEKTDDYKAGNLPRNKPQSEKDAGSPVEFMGTAVFHGDKMVGTLTGEETRVLAMLNGKFARGFFVVEDPLVLGKSVNVNVRLGRKPRLAVELNEEHARLTADIFLEGEITSITSGTNYEVSQYRQLLEDQVSLAMQRRMLEMLHKTQDMEADVVGFGYLARGSFRTYDEFIQMHWDTIYSKADIDVKVTTKIRRTGLLWKTMPMMDDE